MPCMHKTCMWNDIDEISTELPKSRLFHMSSVHSDKWGSLQSHLVGTGKGGDVGAHVLYHHGDPDSKVHGASMGPIWGRQDPGGPYVGPMNFANWGYDSVTNILAIGSTAFIWDRLKAVLLLAKCLAKTSYWCSITGLRIAEKSLKI